jgi:hypothetical protein
VEEQKMTELEKLVNEKKGGSRGSASSNSYLSALVEQKKNEQKMATPYADAVKSGAGAQNLYAAVAKKMQGQSAMQTPYADAAAQAKQSGTQSLYAQAAENAKKSGNAAKGTSVVFTSVYGKADDRASSAGSGKYAGILKASDYTELSKSGESKRKLFGDARYDYINNIGNFRAQSDVQQAQGRGQDYGKYAFMTDDEIGVYNYLYATQGKKAANAYLSDLEPELDKQWYTGTNRATTEALGKNAATRTLASAMTVAAQPTRTITSMIAMADDAVRTAKGQEINPYSKWRQASNITQDLRADTSQHIEETNPGMGGKVGSFVYNTAMSAADSAMNALVAKGIGEAVGLTGDTLMKATNILGSALMSSEAASLSIAESKEKGYSNAGALALGLTRGAIEYASEAVGGEWVIRKIKANPLSFVKSMALTMIPEGMEEVMSDAANGVVNLAIDAAFGTEESGIPKMLEYYRTSGTDWQKKHAELATVLAVLGQEGLSFLGGALATLGSSSVQYSTNRANINQTAERLDTTPKNVVQMMQDAQTENPGVIYALAELTDAENADDLRRKIGTKEDMKRAAEYLTQQMEAGGRSGTQEGVYTAGTQNAPVGAQKAQNEGISTTPAAAINIQEEMNNEQSAYQGRENGSYDLRTGGQAAAEGGAQALAGGRAEIPGGVGADAQADLRQVTPAQLGIRNGGTEAVTVVDARKLGGDAARAYNLLAANNIEPVAVRGAIQVNNGYANAYTESGRVFFRVDAVDSRGNAISPEALVRHELFHNYISEEVLQASDEVIRESMTAEEYDAMYESYRDAYASIYDFENMSEDEIERLLTEEIAADAYAGLNWFSGDAPVQEAVRAETERNAPARRAEAQQKTTGPPEGQGAVYIEKSKSALESNPNSNAYVLASSIPLLQNSEVVKHLTGEELNDASKPLDQQISDLFASVGNVAHREGFGKVELNRYGVDGIINHKPNRSKVLGVAAIKEVIEKGYIIKTNLNWKGRGYDSYMIAAPVGLGDATVYVAAVVNRDQGTNKFYLDEVVDQDGNYINIKNEAPGNTKTGVTVQDGVTRGPKASSDAIVHSDTGDSQEKSSGRASIVVLPDGKKYVQADRQVIFGDDPDSWADQIEGYINRKIRNGEDVILTTDSGDVLKITEDTAGKASFRNYVRDANGRLRPLTDAEYETKLNAEAHIDELVKISEKTSDRAKPDEIGRTGTPIHGDFAKNGWYYRRAWFCDFDGTYYQVTISTPDGINGVVVYNVGQIERRSPPSFNGSSNSVDETGARRGKSSSTVTIRQTEGNSQENSSGKASVEVENRDSDNKKQGRKKLSEAEKYQNTTPKMAENRTVRNVAEYEKQISRMEKRLETGGQATLNEGGGNFYRVNIREENGEYYAYISDGKNVVAKHKSKAKMEAIRWAGDRMRAEIASRILYNPDTKLRGSYQSDLKRAENREYPVFKTESGTEVQTVPFWTWVQGKNGHYGLVVGKDINGAVRAWFPFGGDGTGTVVTAANTTLYAVEGDYESRAWNNEIVAEALDDAEESAAARNARKDKMRESQENDRQEAERLRARENLGAGQRFVPNKSSGEVYRELMGKGKSEVKVQMTGFLKGTPRDSTFKIEVKPTPIGGYYEATIFHDGHKADTLVRALKETAARDAAEEVITMANKNFSEENYQRAKKFEAEKTADEDARIAELFGEPEQLDSTEPSPKSSEAAETENTAAGTTIDATTEKVTSEVIKAERNYREDFEKITSGAMRMFVNAGDTVRRIAKATGSKSLEGYYFNAGAYSQRAGNWIAKGGARTDIDGHRIGASLADTLAPMRKNETKYRDFQLYLLHMHNVDRMKYDNSGELERIKENLRWVKEKYPELRELSNEELRRIANSDSDSPAVRQAAHEIYLAAHNGEAPSLTSVAEGAAYALELERQRAIVEKQGLKPVFGYDVTADDSQTAAQLLEAKNPEFKEWAKEVYKYSDDLIRYRVEAGLITPEFANALKKRYPHYIPTFREEGTNSKRARSARRNGGIVVSNAIGRAVGSDGVLLPLHTALSRKTVSTMRNAGLNQFGLALVREYDRNTKAAEKYIWNVAESEYTPTEAAIESDEDYKPVFENVFSVKDNGKIYDITMDEGLTAAMKAFEPDRFASYGAAKAMKKLNDLFKALCTGYNPFFMVRNLARDMQDAGFYSTDSATWAKMFPSAWTQIAKNGEIWQQYKALGGSYASMLDYTTGMVKEPKSAAGKLAAKYESLGQAIEAAPRLAEFMTILANKGGSKTVDGVKTGKFTQSDLMEAMLGAADITTNFARGGSVTKALNRYLVPFLNPSIQGFDKFIRNATETRSVKAAGSLILKAALMGIAPALLNALAYRDDDEWDDIPANTKANYYLINAGKWFGDGYWIKIPKGRAIAVLSTAAVYGKEKLDGEDVKFSDVFEVIKSNIAPTDIFNQNIATAWTQAKLTNPDNPGTTWYGGNIESDRLQNYRPEDRYDEKTDELSKAIGKLFKVSPKKVNYLLDQYTGVIGDLLLPLITPATKSSHWLLAAPQAAFTIDTTSTNKTTGEYYDLLDDLKYDANDGDIGAGITRKYVSHAGDEVNDYYQQIRAIQNDKSLSDGEKNRIVRALKAQLIERQKEIIAQAEPYREAVSDYLKAHPELSTDNDAAIAEYAEQYEITEDQAESRMDAIVYREANREVFGAEYALRTYNADVYDKARAAYAKGVSYETYYDYYFATKEMHADKDENGKSISGSKKAKVVEYINSLDIPPEQKDALYVAAGYTAKSARNQKWNGGSGGSGGRRGRGKRTALKAPTPKAPEIIIPRSGTASSAKAGGTSKTPKVSGNVIADFTKTASGTDIQKAVTQAKRKAIKAGNRTVYVEEGSPIDYFLKYGKLPSLK